MTICRLHKEIDDTLGCTDCQEFCRFKSAALNGVAVESCDGAWCSDECEPCVSGI